jgi:hypothetical protein
MDQVETKKPPCSPPAAGLFGRAQEKASTAHSREQLSHRDFRPAIMGPDSAGDGEEVGPRLY